MSGQAPIALEGGYRLVVTRSGADGEAGAVALSAPGGDAILSIEMGPSGPTLRLHAARLELAAPTLALDCDDLSLRARRSATVEVGGELREVLGKKTTEVAGAASLEAREVAIEAREGGIELDANDDIRADGERILLNSEQPKMALSWDEYAKRRGSGALPPGGAAVPAPGEER